MSYYDWQHLVKPLTIQPVIEDTVENVKPLSLTPVVGIDSSFVSIIVPAVTITLPAYLRSTIPVVFGAPPVIPEIVHQFNYVMDTPFTIINADIININTASYVAAICVRWRVGNTVYRYRLGNYPTFTYSINTIQNNISLLTAPRYTNQVIPRNFVIEVWLLRKVVSTLPPYTTPIIANDIYLQTGIIHIPTDSNDTGVVVQPSESVIYSRLVTALPETVPTAVDAGGPWTTN